MVITDLNRRDVPVVRLHPADIGKDLVVSAPFGTCPAPVAPKPTYRRESLARLSEMNPHHPAEDVLCTLTAAFTITTGSLPFAQVSLLQIPLALQERVARVEVVSIRS